MPQKSDNPLSFAQSDNIRRVDKDTHCAEFLLDNHLVGVSWHAVDRFRQRADHYIPNKPTAFVLIKRRMTFMSPQEVDQEDDTIFYEDEKWRFVVEETDKTRIIVTCYQL